MRISAWWRPASTRPPLEPKNTTQTQPAVAGLPEGAAGRSVSGGSPVCAALWAPLGGHVWMGFECLSFNAICAFEFTSRPPLCLPPTPLPVPGNLLHFEYLLTFQEPRDHFYTQCQNLLKYLTLCWKQERMGVEDHPGGLKSQAAQPVPWNLPLVGEAWPSLQEGRGSRSLPCRILACSWPWPWQLRAAASPHSTFVQSRKMPFPR